jgi:hypothetical protein
MTAADLVSLLEAERAEAARQRDRWAVDRLTALLRALRPDEHETSNDRSWKKTQGQTKRLRGLWGIRHP